MHIHVYTHMYICMYCVHMIHVFACAYVPVLPDYICMYTYINVHVLHSIARFLSNESALICVHYLTKHKDSKLLCVNVGSESSNHCGQHHSQHRRTAKRWHRPHSVSKSASGKYMLIVVYIILKLMLMHT